MCVVILSLNLMPNYVISSLIVATFKSACMTLLDIGQGAFGCNLGNETWPALHLTLTL